MYSSEKVYINTVVDLSLNVKQFFLVNSSVFFDGRKLEFLFRKIG